MSTSIYLTPIATSPDLHVRVISLPLINELLAKGVLQILHVALIFPSSQNNSE